MDSTCELILDFGLYKTRAIYLPLNKETEGKELRFSSDGQLWTYTALYKEKKDDEWNLVLQSSDFEKSYIYSHFQKKPSLMSDFEKKMIDVFFHRIINTLAEFNEEIEYDAVNHEDNFILYVLVPHIWKNTDGWALEHLVNNIYFSCKDQSQARAHEEYVQEDPVMLSIFEDTPSYLLSLDFGDGETAASYYDYVGDQTAESGERLRRLNLSSSGTVTKIYSAMKKVRQVDGTEGWRLLMNPKDLTGIDFRANFKKRVSEMTLDEVKTSKEFWKLVFDTIVANNDFIDYDKNNHQRNFMLAVACPSGWSDEDVYSFRSLLINAGIPADMIMKESDAAYNKWKVKTNARNTLVIDYGSSTIDVTLVNNGTAICLPIPSPTGARKVEELILDYIKKNNLDFISSCHEINEYIINNAIEYNLEAALLLTIRDAKEQFYSYEGSEELEIVFNNRQISKELKGYLLEEYLSKDDLMLILEPYRKQVYAFYELIQKGLEHVSFKPEFIILSGGASRMPFVKEDVNKVFNSDGRAKLFHDKDQADYVVSDGLALASIDYSIENGHRGDLFWKIREKYEDVSEELKEYIVKDNGDLELCGAPSLLGVKKNGKWGWVNVKGEFEIPPLYDNGFVCCYNGIICQIKKDGKYGAIYRRDGSVAISFEHCFLTHIYNNTFHSMNNNNLGGLVKPGDIRLAPNIYLFKNGAYGRYCEFVKWNSWGRKVEGKIDLETGKEL